MSRHSEMSKKSESVTSQHVLQCRCGSTFVVRFNLRLLFMFVTVIAITVNYVLVPLLRAHREGQHASELEAAGASVLYGPYSIAGISLDRPPNWILSCCGESTFANITAVRISGPTNSDADFGILTKLPALERLDLVLVTLNERQVTDIVRCRAVRCLSCTDPYLSDASLTRISELPLDELRLDAVEVADDWLLAVSKIPTLKSLSLWDCDHVSSQGIRSLVRLRHLESLKISSCYETTDEAIENIRDMKSLKRLGLRRNFLITDRSCSAAAALSQLRFLELTDCLITDSGVSELGSLIELEELNLNGTKVGDCGVAALARLSKLKSLAIVRTECTATVLEVLRSFKSLERLDLGAHFPEKEVMRLKECLPTCRIRLFDSVGNVVMTL